MNTRKPSLGERRVAGPRTAQNTTSAFTIEKPFEIVTLVHGGGPTTDEGDHPQRPTRKPDPITLVRGTALRGQLRFWWRATHGCLAPDVEALRKREDELWGNASSPGLVQVRIAQSNLSQPEDVHADTLGTGLGYGAFATSNVTRVRGRATLTASLSATAREEHRRELEDAVSAWLLFGGIGGRTRRGFGRVSAADLPAPEAFVARFTQAPRLLHVPTLHGASLTISARHWATAEDAHKQAVDALRRFRQEPNVGRNPGQAHNRPGRSRWPEPDAIRRATRQPAPQHAPIHTVNAYPRGAFGMPIVFHFMGHGEPRDQQLLPDAHTSRMASPLLLGPIALVGQWHAMALRLAIPGLNLDQGWLTGTRARVRIALRANEAQQIRPIADNGGDADPITAFLHFFTKTLA